MTLTFDCQGVNRQHDKELGPRKFSSKVNVRVHRHTDTHWTECSIRTTKVAGKKRFCVVTKDEDYCDL